MQPVALGTNRNRERMFEMLRGRSQLFPGSFLQPGQGAGSPLAGALWRCHLFPKPSSNKEEEGL
jgi:hypothetical protein